MSLRELWSLMSLIARLGYLPYRVMRRFGLAGVCCIFTAEFGELRNIELPDGMAFIELSPAMMDDLCRVYPRHFSDKHRRFLESGYQRGFAIFDKESVAASLWLAIEHVPGEINHVGHPATKLPLLLPKEMGYIFNVFVMPPYRGRRLYGAMVSELSKQLSNEDLTGVVLTTEWSNYRALKSVRRMGFRMVGRSVLFKLGRFTLARYPEQPMPGGIRTGRYAGDSRA